MDRTETRRTEEPADSSRRARADLLRAIRRHLDDSGYAELYGVECEFEGGRVILRGSVSSYHLKQRALHAAMRVLEAAKLEDRVAVAPPIAH